MNQVNAILVDDEDHNRKTLNTLLSSHCPSVNIVGEAWSVDSAYDAIMRLKPSLVFLDVMMPKKSGFDLLKMFDRIDFEVIFVSAYNEYAVTAFEYNALGYILKPVDYEKLISCVNKALLKIHAGGRNESVIQFISTLDPKTDNLSKVVLHHREKVVLIEIKNIVSVVSDGDLSHVSLMDRQKYASTKELKLFEGMFSGHGNFARVSKSALINLNHLKTYDKGEICRLTMVNGEEFVVSRRKKSEILKQLNLL